MKIDVKKLNFRKLATTWLHEDRDKDENYDAMICRYAINIIKYYSSNEREDRPKVWNFRVKKTI